MATAKKKAADKPAKTAKAAAPKAAKTAKAPKETVAEVVVANVEAAASPAPVPAKKKVTPEGEVLALFDQITDRLFATEARHYQSRKLKWALKSVAMAKDIVQKHFNHL